MLTFKLLILSSFDIRLVIDETYYVHLDQEADNTTLYGVCLHVPEIVQRPPGILGGGSSLSLPSGLGSRFLVSAPRCYCLLTKVPFFELHFEMLNRLVPLTASENCLLCSCFLLIQ
jgi:hypothetical protein